MKNTIKIVLKKMAGISNVVLLNIKTIQTETGLSYNQIYRTLSEYNGIEWDIDCHDKSVTYLHLR